MKKRILIFLTAAIIALSSTSVAGVSISASAYTSSSGLTLSDENQTAYEDMISEIRAGLANHQSSIAVQATYEGLTEDQLQNMCKCAFIDAYQHTGVANEGDYIRWNYTRSANELSGYNKGNLYKVTITYDVEYYSTKAQENQTTERIAEIIDFLDLDGLSDYEKVYRIYSYVATNVSYDYTYQTISHSTYNAVVNGTAVCQGYATMLYRLMLEAGIDCRIISGTANNEDHAWNIVKLGSKYYLLDATWENETPDADYFLKGSNNFTDHTAESEYETAEFTAQYPISTTNYQGAATELWVGTQDSFKYSLDTDDTTLLSYTGNDSSLTVPAYIGELPVTRIGTYAAKGNTALTSVVIPDTVTSIGMYAFSGCSNLKSVVIPESVTQIDTYAFNNCSKSLVISCYSGSAAETYAKEHNLKYKIISCKSHTYGDWEITKEATCTESGLKERTCTVCGNVDTQTIDKTGHDLVSYEAKAATCTEDGWDAYVACKNCDYSTKVVIKATGHKFKDTVVEATEDSYGYILHTCTVCGYEYKEYTTDEPIEVAVDVNTPKGKTVTDINVNVSSDDINEEVTVKLSDGKIELENIIDGEYTLIFSAESCVPHEYDVTVSGGKITEDITVELNFYGDINSDSQTNIKDMSLLYKHINKTSTIDEGTYKYEVANINGDEKIDIKDYSKIYKHINHTALLW